MNANRELWEKGDFTRIRPRAELDALFVARSRAAVGTEIATTFLLVNVTRSYP